jgi:poly(A) polymerase
MLRVVRHAARLGFTIEATAWEEIAAKAGQILMCPPSRLRDELLKDLRSGAARPFLELLLQSGLFYALLPAWQGRLGAAGEERLLTLAGKLDKIYEAGGSLSESLLWAVFLTALVEKAVQKPGAVGPQLREVREAIQVLSREVLATLEFPRQRQDEVSMLMALECLLTAHLQKKQTAPARLSRLASYPEARLLHLIKEAEVGEVLAALPSEPPPPPAVAPRRRRHRPRRRGRGRETGDRRRGE